MEGIFPGFTVCFIPPPSRTLDPSLPASGLHRHLSASLSPYVSGVLFCQSPGEGTCTFQTRCHFTPGSPSWECSLSQVTPAESVVCPPPASGCREYQLPGCGPVWSLTAPSGPGRLPPAWQHENGTQHSSAAQESVMVLGSLGPS